MWLDRLFESRTPAGVALAARFAEERQKVLAENVANLDTPDYVTRRLDLAPFQAALREAFEQPRPQSAQPLKLRGTAQVSLDGAGRLQVRPDRGPGENVLFHDGTSASLERLMNDVTQNALYYRMATNLLGSHYDGLMNAIRGNVSG